MPVKPSYIKEIGNEILEEYPEVVSENFDKNKEVVDKLAELKNSKTVRNRVAGYITKKENSKEKPPEIE